MSPTPSIAQAGTSCQRCHRRKKKCNRALPRCDSCESAGTMCSFEDGSIYQVGTYPIAYVKRLEEKILNLEQKLASQVAAANNPSLEQLRPEINPEYVETNTNHATSNQESVNMGEYAGFDTNAAMEDTWSFPNQSNFVEELKRLSLEAMAERHLGSSSGLSFAKLTQSVLRRLSPDKADFVFGIEPGLDAELQLCVSSFQPLFGTFSMSNSAESEGVLDNLSLPTRDDMNHIVEFYFAHSHLLYPIINQEEFSLLVAHVQEQQVDMTLQNPSSLFRIWMVLAIGSTAYSSITLEDESDSMLYFNKAMVYFEAAISGGDMAAVEAIALQVSYSFFNQLGPNTWILVGLAARIATGMGLHTSCTYDGLPADMAEQRKRIFFSIYMMDRVVSVALGRPFALNDDDIDIMPFSDHGDNIALADSPFPPAIIETSPMAVPLHILALRRLASNIIKRLYSDAMIANVRTTEETENTIQSLHKELILWRRNMPFPLPDAHPRVPHLSSDWYDFNYYTHLTMLYRPSPLLPTMDHHRIKILATAASMSIRSAFNLHRQERFAYNWLNFLSVYKSALSLIYAITAQPEDLGEVLKASKAVDDLESAVALFDMLSVKFLAAKKISHMIDEILRNYKHLLGAETAIS